MSKLPLVDTLYVGPARCGRTSKLRELKKSSRCRVLEPFSASAFEAPAWHDIPMFAKQAGQRIIVIDDVDFLAKVDQARLKSLLPRFSSAPKCRVFASCREVGQLITPLRERFNVVYLPPPSDVSANGDGGHGEDLLGFLQGVDLTLASTPFLYRVAHALVDAEETYVPYRLCQRLALAAGLGRCSEESSDERVTLENLLGGETRQPAERNTS